MLERLNEMINNQYIRVLLALCMFLFTANAFAQEKTAPAPEKASNIEKDLALFWGKKREIKVIQKREFEKNGKVEVTVGGGVIPNDSFIFYGLAILKAAYHLSESLALEVQYSHNFQSNTSLKDELENSPELPITKVPVYEYLKRNVTLNVMWAPIYGKISFLGSKLTHFDTYLTLGIGFMMNQYRQENNPNLQSKNDPSANVGIGFRWFITDKINIRTEYRQHFFQKAEIPGVGTSLSTPAEITLGVGFLFGL
jgi:outer membrane beta-barrel protein